MRSAVPGRVLAAGCAGVALLAVLAGCGSDGGTTTPTTPTTSAPVTSSSAAPTSEPSVTDSPSSTTSPSDTPTTAGSDTPTASGSATSSPALAICADLAVTVTKVPGGGGVSYGLVSVTNRGSSRCSLPGVPSLRLLDAAKSPMTSVATADSSGSGTALDPGAVASTLLEDRSANCQASAKSAFLEVQPTSAAATVTAALVLPPCALSVKPFVPGTSPAP